MKRVLSLIAIPLLACAGVPHAAAQATLTEPWPATIPAVATLDLPRPAYSVVAWEPSAPTEERSLLSRAMPRSARNGAIGGAVLGALMGATYGFILAELCSDEGGSCSTREEVVVAGAAYGAVGGAVVGYGAGRVWDSTRN